MKKVITIALLMGLFIQFPLFAQSNEQRSREIFDFVVAGKGDSVYVRTNKNVQAQIKPAMLGDTFNQLEKQFGKYVSKSEWQTEVVSGITIYYSDVKFELYELRFITAFDADGKANTIRFAPVPPTAKPTSAISNKKFEETEIQLVSGGYKLPGTLTLPKEKTNVPAIILVHGSGPQDRDETIGPNKPFRDIAWEMAERDIAAIRYDKRTLVYGTSWESDAKGTYDDETVNDALAAVEWAKANKTLDAGRIYIVGHSLGGMLAPRIAERSAGLAGIVMLSGNARPLEDLILEQYQYIASLTNPSDNAKEQIAELQKQITNMKQIGTEKFDKAIALPLGLSYAYWEFSNQYRQVEVARELSLPILILQGERDYQVTMTDFEWWRTALSAKPNVSFKSYPLLNHLYQEGNGKSVPTEYNNANPIPHYVMDDIAAFINCIKL
ncbi:Esterase EstD [termite gut metagenome]|uniref:Esterase EstD n=1 Tax=termite gut metagenome TaxID=433724 RepID=A0A5J4RR17_9ZZZZ